MGVQPELHAVQPSVALRSSSLAGQVRLLRGHGLMLTMDHSPALFIYDCNSAGTIVRHFNRFAEQQQQLVCFSDTIQPSSPH